MTRWPFAFQAQAGDKAILQISTQASAACLRGDLLIEELLIEELLIEELLIEELLIEELLFTRYSLASNLINSRKIHLLVHTLHLLKLVLGILEFNDIPVIGAAL